MKYAGLKSYLAAQKLARLRLTFDEIAKRAGVRLPASAYEHPAWWANDAKSHAQSKAWLEAGYKTENLDLAAQRIEFVRLKPQTGGVREMQDAFENDPKVAVHPMIGALKGTFTIKNWDVTKPALDQDELAEWESNIERKFDSVSGRVKRK